MRNRTIVMILLVLVLAWLIGLMAQPAHAQGPVVPTPAPVTTPVPPVNPVDKARAEAAQWESVANQAVANAQAAINQAYGAIASAQAGLSQAQMAAQQEHAARVAAEQGQIQQAVESSQAALTAANESAGMAREASRSAMKSLLMATDAVRGVDDLRGKLTLREEEIRQLRGTGAMQSARLAQLEPYSQNIYHEAIVAWAVAGVLGFVLIAALMALIIVIAMERRNRWPRFRNGISSALVVPMENH